MYPSPHQWTIPSNHVPPPSMTTQLPSSTISNLPVQTHIPVPSSEQYTLNVPTCDPISNRLQFFDSTDYGHRQEQFFNGIKARTTHQLGPEPTSADQKHI